jgi:PhoH-like ATPase
MVKKTYVLDTNVLLTDPKALLAFEENDVVLPFIVLEELDKHKTRMDEVGANAREVSRQIHELIKDNSAEKDSLKTGISLPNGGKIRVISSTDFETTLKSNIIKDKDLPDNQILIVALGLAQTKSGLSKKVILVSNDVLLRIKANSHGLQNKDHKKVGTVDGTEGIYSGYREIIVSHEDMSELCENQGNKETLSWIVERIVPKPIYSHEFINFKTKDADKDAIPFVVRYMGKYSRVVADHFELSKIRPRNLEQRLLMDLLMDPTIKLITCLGKAGTGKSLVILAAGLEQVLEKKKYKNLIVCRPVQPVGKDIGFLPGTKEEKMEPWIAPIKDNLRFLISEDAGRKSKNSDLALNYYFEHGIIEVEALTYIRGRSIPNAFILIDEAQNLTAHELKTIITRAGDGTKIVLNGDVDQIDNTGVDSVSNGLSVAVEKFKDVQLGAHIILKKGERSELATIASKIL